MIYYHITFYQAKINHSLSKDPSIATKALTY